MRMIALTMDRMVQRMGLLASCLPLLLYDAPRTAPLTLAENHQYGGQRPDRKLSRPRRNIGLRAIPAVVGAVLYPPVDASEEPQNNAQHLCPVRPLWNWPLQHGYAGRPRIFDGPKPTAHAAAVDATTVARPAAPAAGRYPARLETRR